MFIEEPCQAQNHDVMAEIARGTHLPIATGERVFTKWGFREVLEKRAATILQPDLCHAGGITEVRLIAGMAEAYYAAIAPHNPLGPISLAAGVQLAASIPNFLCQEQVSLGEGYLKTPFVVRDGYLDLPDRPGPGHRARRGRPGRQDRPRLEEPREPTTRTTARSSTGKSACRGGGIGCLRIPTRNQEGSCPARIRNLENGLHNLTDQTFGLLQESLKVARRADHHAWSRGAAPIRVSGLYGLFREVSPLTLHPVDPRVVEAEAVGRSSRSDLGSGKWTFSSRTHSSSIVAP